MAEGLEPAMATNGYVFFQYALMSAISIVLTVLVLLVCGFCRRFKKQRSLYLNETNGNVKRAPTQLLKLTANQDVFTLNEMKPTAGIENGTKTTTGIENGTKTTGIGNGTKTTTGIENGTKTTTGIENGTKTTGIGNGTKTATGIENGTKTTGIGNGTKTATGIENGSFTPSEAKEQANTKTEINGDVSPSQAKQLLAGQKPEANGSTDPQGNGVPVRDTKFSLKHRRLPSVPFTTGDNILIHQPSSNQNSQGDPAELPAYEELFAVKAAADVRSSGAAVEGPALEKSDDVEETLDWPPIPHVTFLNMNIYSDVDNVMMPNSQGIVSAEPTLAEDADTPPDQPSVRTPGEGMEALTASSVPPDLSWRFHHVPLESVSENATHIDGKETRDLYSKVKKNVKRSDSVPPPSFEAATEQDDDPPPPVPIKRFNIEDLQDFEDPFPPPPEC